MTNSLKLTSNKALKEIFLKTSSGPTLSGISDVIVMCGRKAGTFSSPKWSGMASVMSVWRAASIGLPAGGHNQSEAVQWVF